MAKVLLSTKEVPNIIKNSGFVFEEITEEKFSLLSFKKLRIDHKNFLSLNNGDFIASAGTLLYKKRVGLQSLEEIYNDFDGGIKDIRRNCFGNYTIIIKKNQKLYAFVDENGIHDLFFISDRKNFSLGTSLYDIALINSDIISLNQKNLIQYSAQYCLIGGNTFFNEASRLQGSHKIVVDLNTNSFDIIKIKDSSFEFDESGESSDFLKKMTRNLDYSINLIAKNFSKIGISMTGGLDSRLLLSGFLRNKVKPNLIYGIGNSSITNTKNEDLRINEVLANRYNLSLELQDWSNPTPYDLNWDKLMKKYGFLSCVYGGSNIFSEMEKNKNDFIEYGYFGEPFRNVEWIENQGKVTFSLDDFLNDFYYNKSVLESFENTSDHYQGIKNAFVNVCNINNIDPKSINLRDFQILHNEYRKNADKIMLNLTNLFCYSASVLSQKMFTDISEKIPQKDKKKSKFMLRLLSNLYPDLLNVEFFSHTQKWVFNHKKMELKKKRKVLDSPLRFLRSKLQSRISMLERLYSLFLSKKNADEIKGRANLRDFFRDKIALKNASSIKHISFLAKYSHNLYIIDFILKNNKH